MVSASLRYTQAAHPSRTMCFQFIAAASNTALTIRNSIYTIWSRSLFVFVWYRVFESNNIVVDGQSV